MLHPGGAPELNMQAVWVEKISVYNWIFLEAVQTCTVDLAFALAITLKLTGIGEYLEPCISCHNTFFFSVLLKEIHSQMKNRSSNCLLNCFNSTIKERIKRQSHTHNFFLISSEHFLNPTNRKHGCLV